VVLEKGYGYCQLGKDTKVDENTLFMIGSNTKAFTATALAMLDAEGKCKLKDPVIKWLPNLLLNDPWVTQHISLTDILCHRLGTETFQGDFTFWNSDLSPADIISKYGKLTPPYEFRTKWGYCNTGFTMAGLCIEKISGKTWEETMKERFFVPLEMSRTLALAKELPAATNKDAAYTWQDGKIIQIPYGHFDGLAPAASISSSAHDLSHWLIAQTDSGNYNHAKVIPFNVIRKTRQPQSIIGRSGHPFNHKHFSLYALGWQLEDYEGREIVSHTGGVDGFVSSVTLLPEEKLGIVILTNTDHNALYEALKWEIIDAYLGLPYRNYSDLYCEWVKSNLAEQQQEIADWRDSAAAQLPSPLPLKAFEGKYSNPVYGKIVVDANKNELTLKFEHHPKLSATLQHIGKNRFLCTYSDPMYGIKIFPFTIKNDKVISFSLSVADFLEFTSYEFVKEL
jgi:CubicO group peptidase (beta-lactamase class C family)